MAPFDPHSYADATQPKTKSVSLELLVNFSNKTLQGVAHLQLDRKAEGQLHLDTRDLVIEDAIDGAQQPVAFHLDPPHRVKGSRLSLALHSDLVTLRFRTSPNASALQWLEPSQTAGGQHPFLFSQCQPIHARSIFPCQDTPQIRITYTAKLTVPADLSAVMSAHSKGRELSATSAEEGPGSAMAVEAFEMPHPIPPYLFALAVGELSHETLSPRVRVYAEPSMVKAAAAEFGDIEGIMAAAEALFGAYGWGQFNMLVMPPSFPYGGMENPTMAFLTPTIIVGDKSSVNVVDHELAHSWTGNLVTNANAAHFWLNEGWTVYAERRILEAVEGVGRRELHASVGQAELQEALSRFAEAEARTPGRGLRFTQLDVGDGGLGEVDPDQVFSLVPYEKGYLFLRRIEETVGRVEFDKFIGKYIATFAFQSINTSQFLDFLRQELPEVASSVDLQEWTEGQGLPPDAPKPHSPLLEAIKSAAAAAAAAFSPSGGTEREQVHGAMPSDALVAAWGPTEWEMFVHALPSTVPPGLVVALDDKFHLSQVPNPEVAVPFLALALRSSCTQFVPQAEKILLSVGRIKYLRPLYSALVAAGQKTEAERIFGAARPQYHPIAVAVVAGLME